MHRNWWKIKCQILWYICHHFFGMNFMMISVAYFSLNFVTYLVNYRLQWQKQWLNLWQLQWKIYFSDRFWEKKHWIMIHALVSIDRRKRMKPKLFDSYAINQSIQNFISFYWQICSSRQEIMWVNACTIVH